MWFFLGVSGADGGGDGSDSSRTRDDVGLGSGRDCSHEGNHEGSHEGEEVRREHDGKRLWVWNGDGG